jgi:hypothetical protein
MRIVKDWCGCEWLVGEDELMNEMIKCCNKVESHILQWKLKQFMEANRKRNYITSFITPYGTTFSGGDKA